VDKIIVVQKRSVIGQDQRQRRIIQSLGLRRIGAPVELKDNNCIRGMINKVSHLVEYKLVRGSEGK
jgi:large subunit ribosomal protein L30